MAHIGSKDGTQIHVKDMVQSGPVVLIHGWPLTGDIFEYQWSGEGSLLKSRLI